MVFYDTLQNNKYVVERYSATAKGYSSTTIYKGNDENIALAKFNGVKPEKMVDVTLYVDGNKSNIRKGIQQ